MFFKTLRRFSHILPSQTGRDQGRLTVICDLDETLCHTFSPNSVTGFQYKPDIQEDAVFDFDPGKTMLYVYKRPYLEEFLDYLDKNFEPILYSTGIPEYVEAVADVIDPKGIFRARLNQDHCPYERPHKYPQYEFVKDLNSLRPDLSRMVILEDAWQGAYKQPDNYIFVEEWDAWYEDEWLSTIAIKNLEDLKDLPDVRPYIREKFRTKYTYAQSDIFYDLTSEDLEFYNFIQKKRSYEELRTKYYNLYSVDSKYIDPNTLW